VARASDQRGQASVELVAILPALIVCVLIAAQGLSAGWALWSAANAARAGARAEQVGDDGVRAARRALPAPLRREAKVEGGEGVRVGVGAPALLPGAPPARFEVRARLDPRDG
jgi:TadE-like protein